jgi:hypothetical protein
LLVVSEELVPLGTCSIDIEPVAVSHIHWMRPSSWIALILKSSVGHIESPNLW